MARKRLSEKPVIMSSGGAAAAPARRKASAAKRAPHASVPEIAPSVMPVEPVAEVLSPVLSPATAVASSYVGNIAPSHQDIARLAYLYWEARGCEGGCPEQDWLRAEQELSAQ